MNILRSYEFFAFYMKLCHDLNGNSKLADKMYDAILDEDDFWTGYGTEQGEHLLKTAKEFGKCAAKDYLNHHYFSSDCDRVRRDFYGRKFAEQARLIYVSNIIHLDEYKNRFKKLLKEITEEKS